MLRRALLILGLLVLTGCGASYAAPGCRGDVFELNAPPVGGGRP